MQLFSYKKTDFVNCDERGKLVQILHKNCKQVNLLISKKGTMRGNHYHKKAKESFFIITGDVKVIFSYKDQKEEKTFKQDDFFEIYPLVKHEMYFLSDCTMIAIYNRNIDRIFCGKDIFKE